MGTIRRLILASTAAAVLASAGCSGPSTGNEENVLRRFPITGSSDIITKSGVSFDREVTSDGNGSIRIEATGPRTVQLYQLGAPATQDRLLTYKASLKTENFDGKVYLELKYRVPGKGEFQRRGLKDSLSGNAGWKTVTASIRPEKDSTPDIIWLNVVAHGTGTAWIDDIRLVESR